jgi:hypothetical protein
LLRRDLSLWIPHNGPFEEYFPSAEVRRGGSQVDAWPPQKKSPCSHQEPLRPPCPSPSASAPTLSASPAPPPGPRGSHGYARVLLVRKAIPRPTSFCPAAATCTASIFPLGSWTITGPSSNWAGEGRAWLSPGRDYPKSGEYPHLLAKHGWRVSEARLIFEQVRCESEG